MAITMTLFKNKYRIETTRLKEWDYSSGGFYFVTLCTRDFQCYLGEVIGEKVVLSKIGEIAYKYWLEIMEHFKNTDLDEFIVMPNHVHGIIVINNTNVETRHVVSLPQKQNKDKNKALRKFSTSSSGSLSTIIGQFKAFVTRWCRKNEYPEFAWQSGFYDHIIRSEKSLLNIRTYIRHNPLKWDLDKNNPENLSV